MVIAPLSANTLAKISGGISDNLITSVVRAWQVETDLLPETGLSVDGRRQRRIFVAPAMNTAMWRHPVTAEQLRELQPDHKYHWFNVLWPVEKELACGDTGDGAMCDWRDIVAAIENWP